MADANLDKKCVPCTGGLEALSPEVAKKHVIDLGDEWALEDDAKTLVRHYKFKGFAKATYLANLCAWLADQEGHHPDISFGWGYVIVKLTTHDIGGLSENDFIWAAKLSALTK